MKVINTPKEVLKQYWGFDSFRGHQEEAINTLLEGKDILFLAPTGLGKSSVYQIPAVCCEGTAIIISPLLALMDDQLHALNNKGIKAITINSSLRPSFKKESFS